MTNENDDPIVTLSGWFSRWAEAKAPVTLQVRNKGLYTPTNNTPMDHNTDVLVKQLVTLMCFNN